MCTRPRLLKAVLNSLAEAFIMRCIACFFLLSLTYLAITVPSLLQMRLHGRSLTKVYEDIGMQVLPEEYLPDDYDGPHQGSVQSIVGKGNTEWSTLCICIDNRDRCRVICFCAMQYQTEACGISDFVLLFLHLIYVSFIQWFTTTKSWKL